MSTPARIHGFDPILGPRPRILILGSMPSARSLAEGQYYGHPRNRFWPLMGRLFGAGPELPYPQRCERLMARGIAVWDVLASCRRPGSLDAAIDRDSETANPIAELLHEQPGIRRLLFNGQTAARVFDRHVLPHMDAGRADRRSLPSTSPANASWSLERLLPVWREALQPGRDGAAPASA